MKKLYRRSVTVHPSPPPQQPPPASDHNHLLSLLPAAILALAAALSPQDREVLAYLISNNNNNHGHFNDRNGRRGNGKNKTGNCDHPPCFTCDCFRCYMSYWVRWDSSPNGQLIHEIIDAFEDGLVLKNKNKNNSPKSTRGKNGRDRRKRSGPAAEPVEPNRPEPSASKNEPVDKKEEANSSGGGGGGEVGSGGEEEMDKGSVRKLVSFIGERIWGAWN